MKHLSMQHIPLSFAYLCQDCSCVGNCPDHCPACASAVLMGLASMSLTASRRSGRGPIPVPPRSQLGVRRSISKRHRSDFAQLHKEGVGCNTPVLIRTGSHRILHGASSSIMKNGRLRPEPR